MKKVSGFSVLPLAFVVGHFLSVAELSGGAIEELPECIGKTATLKCDSAEAREHCDNSVELSVTKVPEIHRLHFSDGTKVNTCENKNPTKPGCTGSGPKPSNKCKRPFPLIEEAV
jgi:hypothetical protein